MSSGASIQKEKLLWVLWEWREEGEWQMLFWLESSTLLLPHEERTVCLHVVLFCFCLKVEAMAHTPPKVSQQLKKNQKNHPEIQLNSTDRKANYFTSINSY